MKRLKVVILSVCFLFGQPTLALACKCIEKTNEVYEEEADAVFEGKVMDVDAKRGVASVEVNRVWKGLKESNAYVYTNETSCGFMFREDQTYLFYAREQNGTLTVGACGGSVEIENANEAIAALGEGSPPSEHITLQEMKSEADRKKWGLAGIIMLSIGGVAFLIVKLEKNLKRK
ncbi:hypothetical protein [Bacillus sp. KH172YL63]|uniref:hypothetical protein n=1 Tax=Bacillus sp. KH172YL63 TaxID=2709784 RepID=UPI0013E4FB09|nr:hypothetical protein [Bacillus sp. KH172YL63]BCB02068.1 hypothetical protein KH172YL63_02010 [Bacillus sp. KH172YL63]